jgi:hypothetical protein
MTRSAGTAEEFLGIPSLLDPAEIASGSADEQARRSAVAAARTL